MEAMALTRLWIKVGSEAVPRIVEGGEIFESGDIATHESTLAFCLDDPELINSYSWTKRRRHFYQSLPGSKRQIIDEAIAAAEQGVVRADPVARATAIAEAEQTAAALSARLSEIAAKLDRAAQGRSTRDDDRDLIRLFGTPAWSQLREKAAGEQPKPASA